jgi:GT2 family glycosyltransferase/glycosyltransferase involved in cell wall biosynthesis
VVAFRREANPQASVIVIGLRDAPLLLACLDSIARAAIEVPYEIIVVLNDPTPALSRAVEHGVSGARVFPFRANLGFGGAVNFAAVQARGDYLVLLNDDCLIRRGWLEALIETERRRPRCAIVGSTYLNPDGTLQEAGAVLWSDGSTSAVGDGGELRRLLYERRVDYVSGGSLLINKAVWHELGGFDDAYYPAYFEDVDFCLRAAERGWEVWYQPHAVVEHSRSASTDPAFRHFLWQRTHEKFVSRWSSVLEDRQSKGNEELAIWHAMGNPIRVLVIDDQLPDPSRGSGFGRMYDVVSTLEREPDIHVAFHARTADGQPPDAFMLRNVRVVVDLDDLLADEGVDFDVVIVSRPHNADVFRDLLTRRLPNARVIYDAESLFHRRISMQAEVETDPTRQGALVAEASAMKEQEHRIARSADHIVCISESEAAELRAATSATVDVVAPWFEAIEPSVAGFDDRAGLGFVAGWAAGPGSPNADGLQWFAREVLPSVLARVPSCRLLVTGADPPRDVTWLAGTAVEFVGSVRDLHAFYNQVRVIVSPTRFGAGVKLKTVEAIQHGVPTVCTEEAAAGLDAGSRSAVWVARNATSFADAVVALLTDRTTWERLRQLTLARQDPSTTREVGVERWPTIVRSVRSIGKAEVSR